MSKMNLNGVWNYVDDWNWIWQQWATKQVNKCNYWDHWLFHAGGPYHIETSPLICKTNECYERVKGMPGIVKHHVNFEKVLQFNYLIIWYEKIKNQGSNVGVNTSYKRNVYPNLQLNKWLKKYSVIWKLLCCQKFSSERNLAGGRRR